MGKLVKAIKNVGQALNGVEPSGRLITEVLRDMGETATGKEITGHTIGDILNDFADKLDILVVNAVALSGNVDLLGKTADALQTNVKVGSNKITGTSKYVTGYTGFSSKVEEQSGNYLAVKAESIDGATITGELVGGYKGPVTLDEDRMIVFRVTSNTQSVRFVATKGNKTASVVYSLSDLVLQNSL